MFSINNTPRESLNGLTPSECLFGRSLIFPVEHENSKDLNLKKLPFTDAFTRFTTELWPELRDFQQARYNRLIKRSDHDYKIKIGDYCLVWKPKLTMGKLSTMWAGPYQVLRNYSPNSYLLVDPETGVKYRRSVRHIRPLGAKLNTLFSEKFPNHSDLELREVKDFEDNENKNLFDELPAYDATV